jgi:methyl-galactoside transport system substrate-binding protein
MKWIGNWFTPQETFGKMSLGKSKFRLNPVKVAVIVYDINGLFVSEVINNLKNIQNENRGKVEFQFFSSNEKQDIQDKILDKVLQHEEFKLLLVELVDLNASQKVINKVKQHNIPIVLFSREPPNKDSIKSYYKAIFVGTVLEQAGALEGEILVDEWNKNKAIIDKNKDNIMQYIVFKGEKDNLEAIARAKYSVLTIKNSGINMMELDSVYSDWNNKEESKKLMELFFLRFGNKIEAIISTNDTMAIGAIEALQSLGYNNGNKERTIPIICVDAVPEARELIKKGFITGTVIQDAHDMAEAIYTTGMNLALNKNPLEGTTYKFDDSCVTLRIPYRRYIPS